MRAAMRTLNRTLIRQPMVVYMGATIFVFWLASIFNFSSLWFFVMAFLFLFEVDRNYTKKLRREIRSEERRSAYQGRPLSDFESADWINKALEKIWPDFLENFISQELLKPMVPWFLDKHKPWPVRKATLQRLELGSRPPRFTGVRTHETTSGDDDLVMDMCLDFTASESMNAVLSVQMRRRLGLGIRTNIHISRLQIEGKVRVGVKFLKSWPFLNRVRVCFENAPYVQMTARPISTHGVNVSELPLIAGWMERMVADVFEQSLVEPNMLVLDIEKLVSCIPTLKTPESSMQGMWFGIQEKPGIALLHLKILEASDLKPSDLNGLADPFVRGSFATCRFKTKILRKTLKPRWLEEFEVPIASWELPTLLVLRVRDKDQFRDDDLGYCEIDIANFRDGQHHDLWIPLQNVKMGRLHVALNITEDMQGTGSSRQDLSSKSLQSTGQLESETTDVDTNSLVDERFEVINLGKGNEGFLSIVSPGPALRTKSWQQRHGMKIRDSAANQKEVIESMHMETYESSSSEEGGEEERTKTKPRKQRFLGLRPRPLTSLGIAEDETQPPANFNEYLAVGTKGTTVRMKVEEPSESIGIKDLNDEEAREAARPYDTNIAPESPSKRGHMKNMAKGFIKHAGKTAHNLSNVLNRRGSSKKKMENEDVTGSVTSSVPDEKNSESQLLDERTTAHNLLHRKGSSEKRTENEDATGSVTPITLVSEPRLLDEKTSESNLFDEKTNESQLSDAGTTADNRSAALNRKGSCKKNEDVTDSVTSVTPVNLPRFSDDKTSESQPLDERTSEQRLSDEKVRLDRSLDEESLND